MKLQLSWGDLAYQQIGQTGKPLIFLHGTGCDSEDWAPTFRVPFPGCRLIAVDFRGHGQTATPTKLFTLSDLAQDVLALIEHLRLPEVILVGHSLGGMVGLEIGRQSSLVTGLVLLEGWTNLQAAREAFYGERFYGQLEARIIKEIQTKDKETRARFDPALWTHFWASVEAFNAYPYLTTARISILEVYGAMGRQAESETRLQIPDNPHIQWHWMPNSGHYLPHEAPEAVAELCIKLAEKVLKHI